MSRQANETKPIKHICAGLLAHVDAGKTTLSEAILFLTGKIRKQGRVDNRDAYLDTYELERSRGITIFASQAQLALAARSGAALRAAALPRGRHGGGASAVFPAGQGAPRRRERA